jgi:hypothetical protein
LKWSNFESHEEIQSCDKSKKGISEDISNNVDAGLLGSNGVWICWYVPTFRRHILPPSSGFLSNVPTDDKDFGI